LGTGSLLAERFQEGQLRSSLTIEVEHPLILGAVGGPPQFLARYLHLDARVDVLGLIEPCEVYGARVLPVNLARRLPVHQSSLITSRNTT
jgi:hypothetical protein